MCGIGGSLAMDATESAPAPWLADGTRGSVMKPLRILTLVDYYPPASRPVARSVVFRIWSSAWATTLSSGL